MAIVYLPGGTLTGLSTDLKPSNPQDGLTFIETDTGAIFNSLGGYWIIKADAESKLRSEIMKNSLIIKKIVFELYSQGFKIKDPVLLEQLNNYKP